MQWKWKACCEDLVSFLKGKKNVRTYIADSPGYCALLISGSTLVGLAFDAKIHDMVSADGTVVDDNIPGPKGDSVPLDIYQLLMIARYTI